MTNAKSSERRQNYRNSLEKHGESPKSLQWKDYRSSSVRYRELVSDIEIENCSVLDAGCGMGDLLPYLLGKASNIDYLGVDATPEFIDIAKKRYEGYEFEVANPFEDDFLAKFDIVISSGVMNSSSDDWMNERKEMISKLYGLSKKALVFNMAGNLMQVDSQSQKVKYANAMDILEYCSLLTPKVIFRNHYHDKDFTIVMYR